MESNCKYCLQTVDLNNGGSFQLNNCSDRYHRDCFKRWTENMDKFYCGCGRVITQEESIALNLPDPRVQCSVCKHPVDMNDKETKGGAAQLVRCIHKYHKDCISDWRQRSRTESIKCGVCERVIPRLEVIEVIGRGTGASDSSPPSSPTSGLTGLFHQVKIEETEENPLLDNRRHNRNQQTTTTSTTINQATNPQPPSNNNNPLSTGVSPAERGPTHITPNRPISPPRSQMSNQNVTNLLNDAARILSNPQLPPLQKYIVTKKGVVTNKLQCRIRTKKEGAQCKHPAMFPFDNPVQCTKHFNLELVKEDADKVNSAKVEVNLVRSVHKAREKLREKTQEINIEAPRLIQASVNGEKEFNSEIAKLDNTVSSVHDYLKSVTPRSSRGSSGSHTPVPIQHP